HDWIQCVDTNDAENAVGKFTEELETMVSEATRVTILSAKTTCLKKWMTPSILKAIRVRDKLKKQHLNQPYNTLRKLRYTQYKNKLAEIINKEKERYAMNKLQSIAGNTKKRIFFYKRLFKSTGKKNLLNS